MASKRRAKIEIIYDMLKSIQNKGGRIKPTHLLYKSNLSHTKMKEYVGELMEKGMMQESASDDEKKLFMITDKGLEFLTEYQRVREFSDSFGL